MAAVALVGPPAEVVDQQQAEKCARTLDEAIVLDSIAVAIDEILELSRKPAHARGPLLG